MAVVFVATNPRVLDKLLKELDEAEKEGLLSPILQHKVDYSNFYVELESC